MNIIKVKYNGQVNNEKLKTRIEKIDGKSYICAPATMVAEAVLNGELLPADSIIDSVPAWNGRILTCHHPQDENGNDVTANSPEMIENYGCGYIFNVKYEEDSTKLKCDIYFDISKKDKNPIFKAAYDAIINSKPLSVSTGYFVVDSVNNNGEHEDGTPYQSIQEHILPDHFALLPLPDDEGAYSWEQGGGVRNNSYKHRIQIDDNEPINFSTSMLETFYNIFPRFKPKQKNNAEREQIMLYDTILTQIQAIHPDVKSVDEIYYDKSDGLEYAVFSKDKDNTYKVSYEFDYDSGLVTLGDIATRIEKISQYVNKPDAKRKRGISANLRKDKRQRFEKARIKK